MRCIRFLHIESKDKNVLCGYIQVYYVLAGTVAR